MSKIADEVKNFIAPIVEQNGCELVDVEFVKKHNGDNLTVFIEKSGGVMIEDCERVHNAISEPLDELDPTEGKPYILNVSSPGIDRPISSDEDFKRNLGELLEIKLYAPLDKKKEYVGTLLGYNSDAIYLSINGSDDEALEIERNLIAKATKYIDF